MKQILLIFTIVTLIICQEERDTYLITGKVKDVPDSTIIDLYEICDNMGKRVGSDTIINGYFEFSDSLKTFPTKMKLLIRDRKNFYGSCDLWVENEVIEITGLGKYLSGWIVSGNNTELKALNHLKSQTRELSMLTDSLYLVRAKNREDKELLKQIRKSADSIGQICRKIEFGLIKENPNSKSALEKLYQIAKSDTLISKSEIKTVYNNLDTIYQNTPYGAGILAIIEDKPIPNIGDKMVDFIASDTKGEKHKLSEFKGKYILLDFWVSACGPCMQAIPEMRELYSNNKEILAVVGVNLETNEVSWKETSKNKNITWINLSDGKGTFAGASTDYGVEGFPTYILINPKGVIIDKWMGYSSLFKQKLEKHIDGLKI